MDGEGGAAGDVHGAGVKGPAARLGLAGIALAVWMAAAGPAGVGAQGGDPFTGVWKLSIEKSVYEAGRAPRSFTRTYEDRGGGTMFLTVESVSASGATTRAYLVYKRDGKPYPESAAGQRAVRMVSVRAVDNLTEEIGTVTDDRVTEGGNTLSVSRDRKTLTQTLKGVAPDGRPYTNVIVYEKQ
jgi:hypothetical protein